nr:defensin alpha 4-like [Desmodus rotundus]
MRTLTLLTALLLAFLAQAQTMEKRADMDSTEDQPGDDEEEDMAVSFTGEERFAREAAGPRGKKICRCSRGLYCRFREREAGSCTLNSRIFRLCCK